MESFFNIRNEYPLMKTNSGLPTIELHLVHSSKFLCDYQTSQRAVTRPQKIIHLQFY
jgi:hypothetical protein